MPETMQRSYPDVKNYAEVYLDSENYGALNPDALNYEEIDLDFENYGSIKLDARNCKKIMLDIENYGEIDLDFENTIIRNGRSIFLNQSIEKKIFFVIPMKCMYNLE